MIRVIDISNERSIELWPGRRLYTSGSANGGALYALPRGAASARFGNGRGELTFGSLGRTTCTVLAGEEVTRSLWEHIINTERPEKVTTIL